MTAPALPPEVEKARCPVGWCDGSGVTGNPPAPPDGIDSYDFCPVCRPEEFAEWHPNTNLARALGAEVEPVAGSASFGVVDCHGGLYADSRDVAEGRVAVLNRSDIAGKPYRVVPLYLRPAAPASVERRMAFLNVEAAVEAEREACAKMCEEEMGGDDEFIAGCDACAAAIRARGAGRPESGQGGA